MSWRAEVWGRVLMAVAVVVMIALPVSADLDVVFLLDTTGSMSGEIREAKERVHQLAEALRAMREGEQVRFGVVAYRDKGDEYVTRVSPLSDDVEITFRFLAALRANGGGDGPEHVLAGLAAAIRDMNWNPEPGVERQAFLIGDAPPHLDYADGPRPERLIEEARAGRIVVNGIGCRSLSGNGIQFFRRIAYATEGSYQHIGRVRTPGSGLAEAMLRAVAPAEEKAARGEPVELRWLESDHEAVSTFLLVELTDEEEIDEASSQCAMQVALPAGVGLTRPPWVSFGEGGLQVRLEVGPGGGGSEHFAMSPCVPPTTPIHVSLGGE